jgi:hypothetical protein
VSGFACFMSIAQLILTLVTRRLTAQGLAVRYTAVVPELMDDAAQAPRIDRGLSFLWEAHLIHKETTGPAPCVSSNLCENLRVVGKLR